MAVALFGLSSVFIAGMRANDYGKHISEATSHAREIMEVIRSRGLAYAAGVAPGTAFPANSGFNDGSSKYALNHNVPPGLSVVQDSPMFKRNIKATWASSSAASYLYKCVECTVTVSWEERGINRQVDLTALLTEPGA